jgi:hypothetical protein
LDVCFLLFHENILYCDSSAPVSPFYGIAWTQKDGKYLWDRSLLSNTPLRVVVVVKRPSLITVFFSFSHESINPNYVRIVSLRNLLGACEYQ